MPALDSTVILCTCSVNLHPSWACARSPLSRSQMSAQHRGSDLQNGAPSESQVQDLVRDCGCLSPGLVKKNDSPTAITQRLNLGVSRALAIHRDAEQTGGA
jgi:hypothetical protein